MITIILSGGAGTRLWPVSRELYPKPFMRLPDGQSLLQKAFLRAVKLGSQTVLTVTRQEYFFSSQNEYRELGLEGVETPFILEPLRRNTAPAIAMAAFWVAARNPDETLLVLSSDQLIQNQATFAEAVDRAKEAAEQSYLVTFGIQPAYPATSFGYIEQGESLGNGAFAVRRFVEKPNQETAQTYLDSGRYHWNAGIFCFKAGVFLQTLEQTSPEIYRAARACWEGSAKAEPLYLDTTLFKQIPSDSVDYAVMEKAPRVAVVPADLGWSDLGSWDATAALLPPDAQGNRVFGEAVLIETENTFVQTEDRVVAVIGARDLVIVDTPDALLVARRDRVQEVKKVVEQLSATRHDTVRKHRTIQRPWGSYTTLEEAPGFKIRRMVVRPGGSLTRHLHYHRSEHWTVLSGVAKVGLGEVTRLVCPNESVSVLSGVEHQISNPGLLDLVVIEVQSGSYLGEDDLVLAGEAMG